MFLSHNSDKYYIKITDKSITVWSILNIMLRGLQITTVFKTKPRGCFIGRVLFYEYSALTVNKRKKLKLRKQTYETVTARLVTRKLKAWDLRLLLWILTTGC